MAKKAKHAEHENLERWLVSYADFITLLFAFFVVMFASSEVDRDARLGDDGAGLCRFSLFGCEAVHACASHEVGLGVGVGVVDVELDARAAADLSCVRERLALPFELRLGSVEDDVHAFWAVQRVGAEEDEVASCERALLEVDGERDGDAVVF